MEDDYNNMKATSVQPGAIVGFSKDGFPIHAASYPGAILGFSKDGSPIRAAGTKTQMRSAGITESLVCGGSSLLFIAVGIGVGWLVADKFTTYTRNKRG